MNNHYNKNLKFYARNLRNNSTKSEIRLWCDLLRAGQMSGYAFLRQRPVLNFIADFMQKDLKLMIEVDGYTHSFEEVCTKDKLKDTQLKEAGFTVLQFDDEAVMEPIDALRMKIEDVIHELEKSSPRLRAKHNAAGHSSLSQHSKKLHPPSQTLTAVSKGDAETTKFSSK